jgi:hypothetical protein
VLHSALGYAAARAGNSVRILHNAYTRCLHGQQDLVSQQIEHILNQRNPSLPVTASGSANRSLYPDPVRHMSVINRPVERVIVNCDDLCRRLERVVDANLVEPPCRPAPY